MTSKGVKFCDGLLAIPFQTFFFLLYSQSSETVKEIFRFEACFDLFVSCPLKYVK